MREDPEVAGEDPAQDGPDDERVQRDAEDRDQQNHVIRPITTASEITP